MALATIDKCVFRVHIWSEPGLSVRGDNLEYHLRLRCRKHFVINVFYTTTGLTFLGNSEIFAHGRRNLCPLMSFMRAQQVLSYLLTLVLLHNIFFKIQAKFWSWNVFFLYLAFPTPIEKPKTSKFITLLHWRFYRPKT